MVLFAGTRRSRSAAFTLLELLVVLAIVGVLTGLVIGVGRRAAESGRVSRAKVELAAIAGALEAYKRHFGDYPRTDDEVQLLQALLGRRGPASVVAINAPAQIETARFTVNADKLVDPWGQPYVYAYKVSAGWTNPGFVLYSCGPDQSDFSRLRTGGFPDATAAANADNIAANR